MLLTVIAALAVGASNAPPQATLTWHEFKAGASELNSIPISFNMLNPPGQSIPGYTAPVGTANPRFFSMYRGDGKSIVGVVGSSKAGGPIDRAWIDWNGDKKFEASEQGKPSKEVDKRFGNQSAVFTFPKPPKGPYGPIHAKLLVINGQMVTLEPTGWMEGVITLDGKPTKVAVIDSNCNGIYGDTGSNGMPDCMVLDTAGTGLLSQSPLTQIVALMQLADGKFWTPVIAKDGSRMSLALDTTPTGSVEFTGAQLQGIGFNNAKGPVSTRSVAGKLTLPEGDYTLTNAQFSLKDDAGVQWMYMVSQYGGPKLKISADATSTINVGGPLKLTLTAQTAGVGYSFSLGAKDKSGADVQGVYGPKMERPTAPQLTITDPEGKVVKTMAFAYG